MDTRALKAAHRRAEQAEARAVELRGRLREAQAAHRAARAEVARLIRAERAQGATWTALANALGMSPPGVKKIAERHRPGLDEATS